MQDKQTKSSDSTTQAKRHYRRRDEWKTLIDNYASSGLSHKAYCQQNKISMSGFYNWSSKFKAESDQTQNPDLVELVASKPFSPNIIQNDKLSSDASSPWRIELNLGDNIILRIQ